MPRVKRLEEFDTDTLPKGLAEYAASLAEPGWAGGLLDRLRDLHEFNLGSKIDEWRMIEAAYNKAKDEAFKIKMKMISEAESIFLEALKNWTITELKKATGYNQA